MDKRRKTGCKENGFSKIDFLEEKLEIYSNQINEKIENIESLFLAQSNKQEEKMLRLSTNKNDNSFSNIQEPIQSRFSLFDQASNMAVKYSFSKTETILIPRQIELKQKKHNTLRSYGLNKSNKSVDEHLDPEELELVLPIESRIDFLEKKLDAVLQNTNEKINTIERLLQHFSKEDLNYKHQRIIKEYQDFSHFDKNKTLRKCDEFLNLLLMNNPQNSPDTNKDEDLMIASSEPTVRLSILDLIQIGQLFENNELSTKLNDFVLANLNSDQLKEVLEIFMKNYDEVKYSSIFLYLIEHRVKWINEYCNNKPEFTWKMPNPVFVDEQNDIYIIDVIREFLQSDSQILEYNCGISLKFARKIVTDFFWSPKKILSCFVSYEQKGYSMNMEIDGVGHNTKVIMTKTRAFYENCIQEHESNCKLYKKELKRLKKFQVFYEKFALNNENLASKSPDTAGFNQNYVQILGNNQKIYATHVKYQEQSFLEANISLLTNRGEVLNSMLELFESIEADTDNDKGRDDAYAGFYDY